jgi:hypothetical protein
MQAPPPFSTQGELDKRDALLKMEEESAEQFRNAKTAKTVFPFYNKGGGNSQKVKEFHNYETAKRKIPSAHQGIAAASRKKQKSNDYNGNSSSQAGHQSQDLVPDFSNLDLLATFASTLLPIAIISM